MFNEKAGYIAERASEISPSLTLSITSKAKKMKADGISVIGFGAGEPDFNTPQYIIEAAKKALDKGLTKYTESSGIAELKRAIVNKLEKENDLVYAINQIIVSNGAKHSLFNAVLALINKGDEVIIPSPYWLTYPELVKLADGVPKYIHTKQGNGFKVTPEELIKAITKKTKMFILNSPSNPTGTIYTRDELFELGKVLTEKGIWILSDEIYEKLIYIGKHVSIASLSQELYNRTIVVNGLSKSYSMTGWRIGYLAAPKEVSDAINAIQSHSTSNPNTIAQYASVEAMTNPEGEVFLAEMVKTFDERRKFMVEKINAIENISCFEPMGAFYVMMNITKLKGRMYKGHKITDTIDLADKMLDCGVAVIPGIAFGTDDYVRLSYAISMSDIEEGISRIEKFVKQVFNV